MPKEKSELQLAGLLLKPEAAVPLYRQLYEFLRDAILAGRLRPGQRLPATRVLATELRVSRNTVLLAFDYLLAEGYLKGKTGAGTFVIDTLPEKLLQASRPKFENTVPASRKSALSRRGRSMVGLPVSSVSIPEIIRPFQAGLPAITDFPYRLWSRLIAHQLQVLPRSVFGYGDTAGYRPLREALADYLRISRAVRCEAEQIIIVNGSQQALDLAARVLLDPGEPAWLEEPGYLGARAALRSAGVRLVAVPVDQEGLNVEAGRALDHRARLVYVTPSHQFPLGVTMSLSRRLQLLQWAGQSGAWILEDDYDSDYRYAGPPLSSLQGLDQYHRVIYIGTFSKFLLPSIRLGYLVAPPKLIEAFISAKSVSDRNSPILEQAALAEFIAEGHFGRHLRRMRVHYQHRQQILVEAAGNALNGLLDVRPSNAGLHLVGWLPPGADDREASARAKQVGVISPALSSSYLKKNKQPGLVLGYAAFSEKEIRDTVFRLAVALGA